MGHRALLAYRRDDATDDTTDDEPAENENEPTYDLHRSHWGGADFVLCDHVSAESPFAAETAFAVDPEPVATDCSVGDIATEYLDFLQHEAFYRVGLDYETTPYHVLWFGLEIDSEAVAQSQTVGHGALVEACPNDADYLRGWFRGTKAVVGEMHQRGALTHEEAIDYLADRAELWAEDREVLRPD